MRRTTRTACGAGAGDPFLRIPNEQRVAQAELDYYDCLARFGHQSAEAHAAQQVWRRLRRSRASTEATAA